MELLKRMTEAWEAGEYCGSKPELIDGYVEFHVTTETGEEHVRIYVG